MSAAGDGSLRWGHGALSLQVGLAGGCPRIERISVDGPPTSGGGAGGVPAVEILAAGHGRQVSGATHADTAIGARLRYVWHEVRRSQAWHFLTLSMQDPVTGLLASLDLRSRRRAGAPGSRASAGHS